MPPLIIFNYFNYLGVWKLRNFPISREYRKIQEARRFRFTQLPENGCLISVSLRGLANTPMRTGSGAHGHFVIWAVV